MLALGALSAYHDKADHIRESVFDGVLDRQETISSNIFNTKLQAQSAVVYDPLLDTVVYGRLSEAIHPLASLTKIMTARIAKKFLPDGTVIDVTAHDLKDAGDVGLKSGEHWDAETLLKSALANSSNDGIEAIGRTIEEKTGKSISVLMNEEAQSMGLSSLLFTNPTGLDSPDGDGGVGNAVDVARLLWQTYIQYPDLFSLTTKNESQTESEDGFKLMIKNTNPIVESIPGVQASKTGYTLRAGGNLATIITKDDESVVLVVLGSTYEGRFLDIQALAHRADLYLDTKPLFTQTKELVNTPL